MTKTQRAAIASYVERKGGEKFRITRNGEVHILGQMPNSIVYGWYFAGFADNLLDALTNPTSPDYRHV